MDGISALGSAGSAAALQTEFQTRVAVMQKNAVQMQGEQALQLIQAAAADPAVGSKVNIQA
jgi:hypothetical protein